MELKNPGAVSLWVIWGVGFRGAQASRSIETNPFTIVYIFSAKFSISVPSSLVAPQQARQKHMC